MKERCPDVGLDRNTVTFVGLIMTNVLQLFELIVFLYIINMNMFQIKRNVIYEFRGLLGNANIRAPVCWVRYNCVIIISLFSC